MRLLATTGPPMIRRFHAIFLLLLCAAACPASGLAQPAAHDVQFWRAIAKNHSSVPQGESAVALSRELSANLASPDPELRDDLAYSILYVWMVYKPQLTTDQLLPFLDEWQANFRAGIGESGTDTVLRRSFSALCLVAIAERDLKTPFIGEVRFHQLLDNTLSYLNDERDLRGFDPAKGWIHPTAHTADLLHTLAQNPLFNPKDQQRLLDAVALRLSTAPQVYAYGEQSRLAVAVSALVIRQDFQAEAFRSWLAALDEKDKLVWKDLPPNDARLKAFENHTYFLEALAARLSVDEKSSSAKSAVIAQLAEILKNR
jgi:hypothetical protein